MHVRISSCVSILVAASVGWADASDQVLANMIKHAATKNQPALALLEQLGSHDSDLNFTKDDVWVALDEVGDALPSSPEFKGLLERLAGISVSGSGVKQVSVRLSEPYGFEIGDKGYAHLKDEISFNLQRDPSGKVRLDAFEGFKLSKSKNSWGKVSLQEVEFDGAVARVDAGLGGEHTIPLSGGAAAPAAPPEPKVFAGEHPGLTELFSDALQSDGSPLGVFLAGLPQLAKPGEALLLDRDTIDASISQALANTGAEPGRSRAIEQRTFAELMDELGTLEIKPLEDGAQLVKIGRRRTERSTRILPVSLGGNQRWVTFQRNNSFRANPSGSDSRYDQLYGIDFSKERYGRKVRPRLRVARPEDGTPVLVVEGGLAITDPDDLVIHTSTPGPNRKNEGLLKSLGKLVDAVDKLSPQDRHRLGTRLRMGR